MNSSIDKIRFQCRAAPAKAALSIPGPAPRVISYATLERSLNILVRRLHESGVRDGQITALMISDPLLHIVTILALEQLGAVSLSLTGDTPPPELVLDRVLTDDLNVASSDTHVFLDNSWLEGSGELGQRISRRPRSQESLCRIILTSGTTGRPKAVPITHKMVSRRLSSFNYVFGADFPHQERMLCCFGMASSLGYLFCLHMLTRGGMFCMPESSVERTLRNVGYYNIDVLAASSATLAEIWASLRTSGRSAEPLELVLTAGSPLSSTLAERVRTSICPRIINFYGTTEVGVVASARVETLQLDLGETGYVVPGIDVESLGLGSHEGQIRVRGLGSVREYLGHEVDSAEYFDDGWFRPGDLGQVSSEGMLSIRGRKANVVNLGGTKTTLEEIEAKLAALPSIKDVGVLVAPDVLGVERVIAFIVTREDTTDDEFFAQCKSMIPRVFWPINVRRLDAIPRGPSGKIIRKELSLLR
jgi:long-chain acyl-CoA synthetase